VTVVTRLKERCGKLRRRMRADANKGSAAMEFAFVAPIFFLLLMAIMEVGIIFFAQGALQTAVSDTGRLVRTGQGNCFSTTAGVCVPITQAQFRTQICQNIAVLLKDCTATSPNLVVDVQNYPSGFATANNTSPLDSNGNLVLTPQFLIGNACDVVLVRAFYKWPVFTPMLKFFLANVSGSYHLLATATVFRNEPFNNGLAGC
jgi:Flp pilus assembly protein TadG